MGAVTVDIILECNTDIYNCPSRKCCMELSDMQTSNSQRRLAFIIYITTPAHTHACARTHT